MSHPEITAENVTQLFPDVVQPLHPSNDPSTATPVAELAGADEEQTRLMNEMCIIVDDDENEIGMASKAECHLLKNINRGLVHRAFSVLLFDSQNRLLLQRRASEKVTWPDYWTNTCCSHPLAIPGETGADFHTAMQGARRAARRKLDHELGIKLTDEQAQSELKFMTRMQYGCAFEDGVWGENEVTYIFLLPLDTALNINENEIRDYKYLSREEFAAMYRDTSQPFTPWFKHMVREFLPDWWAALEQGELERCMNDPKHYRF
ncbi:isopentenyl-diphosphate delta3-delta2-isomerase [Aspergillus ellipticus CBS 707.79]|uniref:isopentenyl-diphosphate Delta-isomerase n=1 Tax=Aspergillus ellipticus CBS 707.79 TaxID=1448320 RepID=A0A319CS94_9EURO|nr:isopentenyl-diphosphate delta3-delta2-isomerase [Aspergillus ellipticus CBS 707.79]